MIDKKLFCDICGLKTGYFHKNINGFDIYECKECKLLWVEEITQQKIISFYNSTYFNNNSKMGYKDYLGDEKNHRKNARNIISTVNKIKDLTKLQILDVGCAYGFLLDEAKKIKQCETYGVEISNYACEYARDRLGVNVFNCELDHCDFDSNFFDVVFLIGTIEHLISPKKTLEIIHNILKPYGLIVITTLDTDGLIPICAIKPPEHLFYFNHDNLLILLNNLGYKKLLRRTYFVNYCLHDIFHRISEFLSFSFFGFISEKIKKSFPNLSVTIPSNEMIVVAKKVELQ